MDLLRLREKHFKRKHQSLPGLDPSSLTESKTFSISKSFQWENNTSLISKWFLIEFSLTEKQTLGYRIKSHVTQKRKYPIDWEMIFPRWRIHYWANRGRSGASKAMDHSMIVSSSKHVVRSHSLTLAICRFKFVWTHSVFYLTARRSIRSSISKGSRCSWSSRNKLLIIAE